jgi:putative phosphonate metabolism protein
MTEDRPARYAIYFTPHPSSLLARFGAQVLGYDPASGTGVAHLDLKDVSREELIAATEAPRRYGFHATLVAPFYLKDCDERGLRAGVEQFCRQTGPVALGKLDVRALARFVALMPGERSPAVVDLAGRCVEFFDRFRAPLGAGDLARRNTNGLSFQQRQYLDRWGYPYVFDEFRIHMTLTGAIAAADTQRFRAALASAYHPISSESHGIDAVSVLRQSDVGARFIVIGRYVLG